MGPHRDMTRKETLWMLAGFGMFMFLFCLFEKLHILLYVFFTIMIGIPIAIMFVIIIGGLMNNPKPKTKEEKEFDEWNGY